MDARLITAPDLNSTLTAKIELVAFRILQLNPASGAGIFPLLNTIRGSVKTKSVTLHDVAQVVNLASIAGLTTVTLPWLLKPLTDAERAETATTR